MVENLELKIVGNKEIIDYFPQCLKLVHLPKGQGGLADLLTTRPMRWCWSGVLGFIDSNLVAQALAIRTLPPAETRPAKWELHCYVLPQFRHQGVARALLSRFKEEHNRDRIVVQPVDKIGHLAFQGFGFIICPQYKLTP